MRLFVILGVLMLSACAPAPAPESKAAATTPEEYGETVRQLAALNREATGLMKAGKPDAAAALITRGQSLTNRVLGAPQLSLEGMEAVSDLDDLYGRMLLANGNYGWARLTFQKNRIRWKTWKPQTADTQRRFQEAESAIAECDRHIAQ